MGTVVSIVQSQVGGYGPDANTLLRYNLENLSEVDIRIRDGLKDASDRLEAAKANEAYYRMENRAYIEKREAETDTDFANRPKRCSYMTYKAVSTLSKPLYTPGPIRTLERNDKDDSVEAEKDSETKEIQDWLLKTYKLVKIDTVLGIANRKAILNDVCAIQLACTGNPDKPIRYYTYGGNEFEVFCHPDEPTEPWAVVTIAVQMVGKDKKKRVYTLYTDDIVRRYETKPVSLMDTSGGIVAYQVGKDEQHGYGSLPFVFFHNETPVDQFWGGGIGTPLRETNAEVDRQLSDVAELIEKFLVPDTFTRNIAASWRYEKKPGRPQRLVSTAAAVAGDVTETPEIFHLQPQLNIEEAWLDTTKTVQSTFFELDIPLSPVRDMSQAPTSGLQVIAESIPFLNYLKARQPHAGAVETELAKKTLSVAGYFYGLDDLIEFSEVAEISLTWMPPSCPVPTPERNDEDEWELNFGLSSPIDLISRRLGVTREQAIERATRIAADNKLWKTLFPDQGPVGQGGALGQAAQTADAGFGGTVDEEVATEEETVDEEAV